MRTCHNGGIELTPPRTQMLVWPDQIGRAGRRIKALRKNSALIQKVFADHRKGKPVKRTGFSAVFAEHSSFT